MTAILSRVTFGLAVVGVLLVAPPVFSHHAIQAQFDFKKPVRITGTLTRVEWINPHAIFTIETKDAKGAATTWTFETLGPGGLRRAGLSRAGFFKPGHTYTASGFAAWNGKSSAFMKDIAGEDGKVIQIWFGDPNAN